MRYAPLHNHTIYSVKDAIATPREYLDYIYEYNESQDEHEIMALAITEHGNLYSLTENHLSCTTPKKGDKESRVLKPIYGNEIYHINEPGGQRFHLVLLAKNDKGLKNLIKLTSEAGLNSIKPSSKLFQLLDTKSLKKYGEGIIALSACLGGIIPQLILSNEYEQAKKYALVFNKIFEEFYLEIQPFDTSNQKIVNSKILQISKETGIELVITSDSHYVRKEEREYHDIIKDIDAITNKKEIGAYRFDTENRMWTPHELIEWCKKNEIPLSAIENTAKIADSIDCSIEVKDPKGLMPTFPVPKGFTEDSYLIKIAYDGLLHRIKKTNKNFKIYIKRLNYELDVITQMGYSGYFLILNDWLEYCKNSKIPVNTGRGSGAGSLVCYCLNITKLDPIEGNLLFERFLNPERLDEPDKIVFSFYSF